MECDHHAIKMVIFALFVALAFYLDAFISLKKASICRDPDSENNSYTGEVEDDIV